MSDVAREPGPIERALLQAHAQVGQLLSDLPTFFYVLRVEGAAAVPVWAGINITHLMGYTPAETLHPGWWAENIHPADREAALAAQARLLTEGRLSHEYRFRHVDGSYRWVRDELRLVRDVGGSPREVVGAWFDITDLKRTEVALRESEARYKALVQAATHAGKRCSAVGRAKRRFGVRPECRGNVSRRFCHARRCGRGDRLLGSALPTGPFRGVTTVVLKLFQIVPADRAVPFGRKDYQQAPGDRADGRGFESAGRKCRLSAGARSRWIRAKFAKCSSQPRRAAQCVGAFASLRLARELFSTGERDPIRLRDTMLRLLADEPTVQLEYLAIVEPTTLAELKRIETAAVVLIAARLGSTRLIDNEVLESNDER